MSKAQAEPQMQLSEKLGKLAEVVHEIANNTNGGQPKAELIPAPPQAVTPMTLMQIGVSQGVDLDRLERLWNLQLQWDANEARKSFDAAMAAFKADAPSIEKNKHVRFGQTEYDHATLDHVCEQITAALSKQGISHRWKIEQPDKVTIRVTCILRHRQGHSEETTLEAGADTSGSKNAIQAIGSAVTYLERYTLLAATGLAAKNGDNDGGPIPMAGLDHLIEDIRQSPTLVALKARFEKAFKDATHANNPPALKAILAAKDERKKELETA